MSTPSPESRMSSLTEEEMEPYVRKKRGTSETRNKMIGLNEEEQNILRTSINSRERKRMHDLNDAHEELRSVLPYSNEANSRKLSKIGTIILASNYIRKLTLENARVTAELAALRAQLSSESSRESIVPTGAPPLLPMLQFSFHCNKSFGQPCFCVACISGKNVNSSS